MQLTLRKRAFGLVGLVLVLGVLVLGITYQAIGALEEERATQQVRSLFLSADRHRQAFLRSRDMLHATRADEALVRADSVFRASLAQSEGGALGATMRDSIETYRSLLFRLVETVQQRGLGDGHGLVGRFRVTAQNAADLLRESGRPDLLVRLLAVRQAEQDFLRNGAARDRNIVKRGVAALDERAQDLRGLRAFERRHLHRLLDEYLTQFLRVGRLTVRTRRLDARTSAMYDRQAAALAQAARQKSALAGRYQWIAGLTILATCLLGLGAAGWTTRTLVRPILKLQKTAERIASGDETARVPASAAMDRELQSLAEALDKVRVHVAERRAAEDELRTARQFSETILESVGEGIVAVDDELRYVTWNAYAERFTGLRAEDVIGRTVMEVFPKSVENGVVACYRRALGGEATRSGDTTLAHAETGKERWYAASYAPLHSRAGGGAGPGDAAQGVVGTFHDVTARKRAEDHLRRAKERAEETARLKSSFVANMSHELRTPLASVLGFAEAIADDPAGPHIEEFAGHIQQSGERLQRTMEAVLSLSRLEAGTVEPELEAVALASEARAAADLLRPLAREKPVTLHVEAPAQAVPVRADRAKLGQVLNNLVANAAKFTEEGRVTIEVERGAAEGLLHVRDTGAGIGEDFLPHLYEAFRQESTGLTRDFEGAGLGLAITQQLVDLMGGAISVESTKGKGTCFTVALPLAASPNGDGDASPRRALPAAGSSTSKASLTVLVIEDNENTRALARHHLRSSHRVRCAPDAASALAAAREEVFDVVLTDIDLGAGPNGTRLLERLRSLAGYTQVPAVAFTAHAMPGDAERFREAGFDEYLGKPFSKEELLDALEAALSQARDV